MLKEHVTPPFDLSPLYLIIDSYYDYNLEPEIISLMRQYVDIFKTDDGKSKIVSLFQKHTSEIVKKYVGNQYKNQLSYYITDETLILLIMHRLYFKIYEGD